MPYLPSLPTQLQPRTTVDFAHTFPVNGTVVGCTELRDTCPFKHHGLTPRIVIRSRRELLKLFAHCQNFYRLPSRGTFLVVTCSLHTLYTPRYLPHTRILRTHSNENVTPRRSIHTSQGIQSNETYPARCAFNHVHFALMLAFIDIVAEFWIPCMNVCTEK